MLSRTLWQSCLSESPVLSCSATNSIFATALASQIWTCCRIWSNHQRSCLFWRGFGRLRCQWLWSSTSGRDRYGCHLLRRFVRPSCCLPFRRHPTASGAPRRVFRWGAIRTPLRPYRWSAGTPPYRPSSKIFRSCIGLCHPPPPCAPSIGSTSTNTWNGRDRKFQNICTGCRGIIQVLRFHPTCNTYIIVFLLRLRLAGRLWCVCCWAKIWTYFLCRWWRSWWMRLGTPPFQILLSVRGLYEFTCTQLIAFVFVIFVLQRPHDEVKVFFPSLLPHLIHNPIGDVQISNVSCTVEIYFCSFCFLSQYNRAE